MHVVFGIPLIFYQPFHIIPERIKYFFGLFSLMMFMSAFSNKLLVCEAPFLVLKTRLYCLRKTGGHAVVKDENFFIVLKRMNSASLLRLKDTCVRL